MTRPLTAAQQELADRRAEMVTATATALTRRSDDFFSIRDARASARQAGVAATDWKAERDMVRAAGVGRMRTSSILGDWESMINAAEEAARWHGETVDLVEVSRRSLAWCIDGRPDGPMREILEMSREVTALEIHDERPDRPTYRRLLDDWRQVIDADR